VVFPITVTRPGPKMTFTDRFAVLHFVVLNCLGSVNATKAGNGAIVPDNWFVKGNRQL